MIIFRKIDDIWLRVASEADWVAGLLFIVGAILLGFSFFIGVHKVEFSGNLQGVVVPVTIDAVGQPVLLTIEKEVGYAFAPNWGLTGLVLLPLAVLHAMRSRASIEPLINELIERGMLVDRDFAVVNQDRILADWKRESTRWTAICSLIFILCGAFVLFGDFVPVVYRWLVWDAHQVSAFVQENQIVLLNDTYEFDWSISAIFENSSVDNVPNLIFSFAAYLVIAIFGPSFLLAAFLYLISIASFFSPSGMERRGVYIVPNLKSKDDRLGFEVFERFFHHLVYACLTTAIIAVSMHLQNVYLRSATHENIFDMVFSKTFQENREAILNLHFGKLLDSLVSTTEALNVDMDDLTLQTFVSAFALFMLSTVVFLLLWTWLRMSAIEGAKALRQSQKLTAQHRKKLDEMKIWPVGWISINLLVALIIIVCLCMWYVNFVTLVLAFVVVRFALGVFNMIYDEYIGKKKGQPS